jgi:hypothetical protein
MVRKVAKVHVVGAQVEPLSVEITERLPDRRIESRRRSKSRVLLVERLY